MAGERNSEMAAKLGDDVVDESLMDFTLEELREFLEADLLDVQADPEFKERLRRRLWDLVVAQSGERSDPEESD